MIQSFAIDRHVEAIRTLCVRNGVATLELFGSRSRGDFDDAESDVDFLVEFHDLGWQGSFRRYMGLKLGLEDLLGRPVDLVELTAVTSRFFLDAVRPDRRPIYAA